MKKLIDWVTTAYDLIDSKLMTRFFGPIRFIDHCDSREPIRSKLDKFRSEGVLFLDPVECEEDHYHTYFQGWGGAALAGMWSPVRPTPWKRRVGKVPIL